MAAAVMNPNDEIDVLSLTKNGTYIKDAEIDIPLPSLTQTLNEFNNSDDSSQITSNGVNTAENIPIAIVGMAMRLPGGIGNEEQFWDTLINKKDKRSLVPADRWNVDGFYSKTPKRGSVKTKHGYFLEDDALRQFDASLFSITRTELEKLDPQHRLLLEVTRECLENAGELNWRGKNIGCYVGVFGEDWLAMHAQDTQDSGLYRITGVGDFVLANRVSYEYDLKGPSITVKTGCSAALIGLHMACQAIKTGEITSAIVGGTNLLMTPSVTIAMTEQGVLSPDGSCKTFDAAADGYARGEAINALYVKRLDEAIRDGNPIRAIVRSTGTNCDGKTPGISYPSDESHEALIRRTYELAGLQDFCQTAVVECHGTGTAIGDRQETTAVGNVFGEKGVYITSVKPNMGHSEGASGLTSVIKSVLALENKTIPPNIKFQTPSPTIPFKEKKLEVPVDPTPWPEDRHERVSVNSFGIGGANAHAILDSAESFGIKRTSAVRSSTESLQQKLVVFSANHASSVRKGTNNLREYLEKHPDSLKDVAYTTGVRREHHPHRSFAVSDGTTPLEFLAPSRIPSTTPEVTFVFTGQGAQWATMGAKLVSDYPSVSEDLQELDDFLSKLPQPPSWTIAEELCKSKTDSRLNQAEFSQPLCTAVQIVIVNLLRRWSIFPSAVIGHSSGEFAAAYASGSLTSAEAIIGAYYRGLVTKQQKRPGAMAAVGFGREEVAKYLADGVTIACENSPESTTISGDDEQINVVLENITNNHPKAFARRLQVEMAYHSQHMLALGEQYQALLEPHISSSAPEVPFYSTVLNAVVTEKGELNASYWRKNLESPVLFNTTMEKLLSNHASSNLFLEIGPHSALAGPLRQIFKRHQPDAIYVPTLVRNENDTTSLLTAAGNLYLKGLTIDLNSINSGGSVLTTLPTYPWHHEDSYWDESRITKDWRLRKFPRHDLLGSLVTECSPLEPVWRNMLCLDDVSWVRDHVVSQDIVFPGAGYIAMAGEAIRQVTGIEDFTIRNYSLNTALIVHESSNVEIMFTLRPYRLTMSLDSDWHDFAVFSYNGTSWTKHCAGQVRAGKAYSKLETEPRKFADLPRRVQSARWYQAMRKVGINYGPAFQGLEDISAHPIDNIAVARVPNNVGAHESAYQLHPTTLDFALQLFTAAAWKGQPRDFVAMSLPSYFGEIYVKRPEKNMKIELVEDATVTTKGTINGNCVGTVDGEIVLRLQDVKLSSIESDDAAADLDSHAGVRLHWKPDIDFLDPKGLVRPTKGAKDLHPPLQKLVLLCSIEAQKRLAELDTEVPHLRKFKSWLDAQVQQAARDGYLFVEETEKLIALPSVDRLPLIEKTALEVQSPVKLAVMRIFNAIEGIFKGEIDALDLLMQDGVLTKLYDSASDWNYKDFLGVLSHSKPHLRILEIGAGTGGTTAVVLEGLVSAYGEPMFSSYTFTDISPGFFVTAKERFASAHNMEFSVLDISQDPADQGFELGSYDLIIAANVLHATPNLGKTLTNVRKLLQPKGKLLLQELCSDTKEGNFIMGVLPGWWLGEEDSRPDEPYVTPERWAKELSEAGFAGADAVVYDNDLPYHHNATIIASPLSTTTNQQRISILRISENSPIATRLASSLNDKGYLVDFCSLAESPKPNQDIISILDFEGKAFLEDISAENFDALKAFITNLKSSGLLWLTKSCQIESSEPQYAQILGLARALRNELSADFATLEIDNIRNNTTFDGILNVLSKFQSRSREHEVDPEFEYAIHNGLVHIPRFHWFSIPDELCSTASSEAPKRLDIGKRGALKTLYWAQEKEFEVEDDEVSLQVRATGMNFKDILSAMGILDESKSQSTGLGVECAGIVTQVGPKVTNLKIGDRVLAFTNNSYATRVKVSSALCAKIPDKLSFEDAATMPCVYGTVIYGLQDMARLETDQTVLIHSACGGIGIAAIQICRMIGAKIYVTVGNDEKVEYLMRTFDIPRNHIFNSRNASFLPELMRETNGRGVDVVLNSLSGDLLHSSWACVAEYGKMIEIGKRDFIGQGRLEMNPFLGNRTFFGVDLAQLCVNRPLVVKRLLENCMQYFRQGAIQPIRPTKIFDAIQIEEAFRFMQKGQHIGKIVVSMPIDSSQLPTSNTHSKFSLRSDVSYLLVGGLGGLGQSISTWMVENGARHLIYLSRSGGKRAEDVALITELNAQGCTVQVVAGSVANLADVQRVINEARFPIAGIVQMSMVLKDGGYPQMTHKDWEIVQEPKVKGTWNLHNAFASVPLDFFVLFSSVSGQWGQWGQSNYGSAGTFLDAFNQYRQGKGLPASVIDVGVVGDVGYVSENPAILQQFKANGVQTLRETDVLDTLELAIVKSKPKPQVYNSIVDGYVSESHIGCGYKMTMPITAENNRNVWKRDIRMSVYRNLDNNNLDDNATSNEGLKELLVTVSNNPQILKESSTVAFLAQEIGKTLFSFMMRPAAELDIHQPLKTLGVDSLVAIELRNWCRQRIGVELTVLEIMGAASIESLGKVAAEGLLEKIGSKETDAST